jgi:hypothetical protein
MMVAFITMISDITISATMTSGRRAGRLSGLSRESRSRTVRSIDPDTPSIRRRIRSALDLSPGPMAFPEIAMGA